MNLRNVQLKLDIITFRIVLKADAEGLPNTFRGQKNFHGCYKPNHPIKKLALAFLGDEMGGIFMHYCIRRVLVVVHLISFPVNLEVGMRPNILIVSPVDNNRVPQSERSIRIMYSRTGLKISPRATKISLLMYGKTGNLQF